MTRNGRQSLKWCVDVRSCEAPGRQPARRSRADRVRSLLRIGHRSLASLAFRHVMRGPIDVRSLRKAAAKDRLP
jgi:hypothetical protein